MKAPLLTTFFSILLFSPCLRAQKGGSWFGFTAGGTFSSYKATAFSISENSKLKVGLTLGVTASLSLSPHFSVEPAINFTQKGGVVKEDMSNTTETATFDYLEVPLNFVFYSNADKTGLFIGAGPSIAGGLGGKYKVSGSYTQNGNVHFGSGANDDLKSFDVGANLVAGFQVPGGWLITGNYTWGVNNLSNDSEAKFRNNYFSLRLGYYFNRNPAHK